MDHGTVSQDSQSDDQKYQHYSPGTGGDRNQRARARAGYVRGDTPWVALERLGVELGATDLTELANTIALAGEEGAAVRATVAAKARTIRERMSADSEVAAADLTERMSLPSVLLVFGFLLFICFPAFVAMTNLTG